MTLRAERLAAVLRVDHLAHDLFLVVEVHPVNQLQDRVGAHAAFEVLAVAKVHLAIQHFVFDDLTAVESLEGVEGLLGQLSLFGETCPDAVELLLGAALQCAKLRLLGAVGFELDGPGLDLLELVVERLDFALGDLDHLFLAEALAKFGQVQVALVDVDERDHVRGEVDDLLQLLGLELFLRRGAHEQVRQPRPGTTQVPDVHDRRRQRDVAPCGHDGPCHW